MIYDYVRLKLEGLSGPAYVRRDADLGCFDSVIFDCDGVLIDVRPSYNVAIKRSVAYILGRLVGSNLSPHYITDQVIYSFRRSGGFNLDWETTYAILMGVFAKLPSSFQHSFRSAYERLKGGECVDPIDRLNLLASEVAGILPKRYFTRDLWRRIEEFLRTLASGADSSGHRSVDRLLFEDRVCISLVLHDS